MVKKKHKTGFSLIELSVTIAVLGIMIYSALAVFAERSAIDKVAVTNKRMDEIVKALRIYYLSSSVVPAHRRLPCPAQFNLPLTHSYFAREIDNARVVAAGVVPEATTCAVATNRPGYYSLVDSVLIGALPSRTLNLPDSYAFDAWGNRFTYAIDRDFASGTWPVSGEIRVDDNQGNTNASNAVYVLISHGKNGLGAYNRNGSANSAAATVSEQENGDADDKVFRDDYILDHENAGVNFFDDIVRWKTRELIDYE